MNSWRRPSGTEHQVSSPTIRISHGLKVRVSPVRSRLSALRQQARNSHPKREGCFAFWAKWSQIGHETRQLPCRDHVSTPRGGPKRCIELICGGGLHRWHDVTVRVQRDFHRPMPELFAHHLGMNSLLEEDGRVRVSQIVEANARKLLPPCQPMGKLAGEVVRIIRRSIRVCEDEPLVLIRRSELQFKLCLLTAMDDKRRNRELRKRDRPGARTGLRRLVLNATSLCDLQ